MIGMVAFTCLPLDSDTQPMVREGLTLTKERGESGFLAWLSACCCSLSVPAKASAAGTLCCSENTWMVPLSLETASQSGQSPFENAMLCMHAGSAPLRSSYKEL